MTKTWKQLGERLDRKGRRGKYAPRQLKPPVPRAPRQPRTPEQKLSRNRHALAAERNKELIEREKAWEAMMTERIRTESALIRAENDERKKLLSGPSQGVAIPPAHLWRGQLPSGIDFLR